jgi:aspartate aminotransferase/aminotransferase
MKGLAMTNHDAVVEHWISERMSHIESSGIRKVFELAKSIKDPINLSIGQPDFDVPEPVKKAAKDAIDAGRNTYTLTQGIPELRQQLLQMVEAKFPGSNRDLIVTSGTSGALVLALCCVVDPGDEVIIFDPYFVMYPHLVSLAGGKSVFIDTYPDFEIDIAKVEKAITKKTKVILFNNPANPTGKTYSHDTVKALAALASKHGVLLISDEIYSAFHYDGRLQTPADYNHNVLVLDGFSKSYGMTGWRMGYAHGPAKLIQEMIKLQQFTFVCAPSMVQYAGITALNQNMSGFMREYKLKRDFLLNGIKDYYDIPSAGGAFYLFPKAPGGNSSAFVEKAIQNDLLIIPGKTFSSIDSNFRVSFAAKQQTLERGIEVLQKLVKSFR